MTFSKAPGADCANCPLADKPCAPTMGPTDSEVILVSRSPGFHEAKQGKPFSGPSGKVLDHLLSINGVERKDIRVTNVVLCAPDKGEVPKEAIQACSGRLKMEVQSARLVIAAGSEAVTSLVGRGSIDRYRGYRIDRDGQTFVATNNPALVLRDDSTFPNLVKDFKRAFNPTPSPTLPTVRLFRDEKSICSIIASIAGDHYSGRPIAVDIESRGGLTHKAELVSIQFAATGDKAVVLGEPGIRTSRSLEALRNLLELRDRRFVYHNGKFDVKILRTTYGIKATLDEDTLLLSYCLDERSGGDDMVGVHGLEYLLMEEFAWPKYETPGVKKFKKSGIVEDWEEFAQYAGKDVAGTAQLFGLYQPKVDGDPDLHRAYREVLLPAAELTMQMEMRGCIYDVNGAADILENEVEPELKGTTERAREISGKPLLNLASPTQVAKLFYDEWFINHVMRKRPDKDRSVDDSARKEILAGRFVTIKPVVSAEVVQAFTKEYDRFQKLSKQKSNYLIGLIAHAEKDPEHRIYTDLVLHGTNSGRLSSRKPNLQNITRTKPDLPDIRRLFLASPGRLIVQADYSQAELRTIAARSGDSELTRAYAENLDLHNIAAARFYGENFTPEQRSRTKNMNFGVAYRQSAATFQEKHNIPEAEGQKFIDWWWVNFKGVAIWERELEQQIRSKGVLVSSFGRKRRFHLLTKENLQACFREGINFLPQSDASDLTLTSAIIVNQQIDQSKAALWLTVHDSILGDVVEDYVDEYSTIVKQVMEARAKEAIGWELPFKVEIGVGKTWAAAK